MSQQHKSNKKKSFERISSEVSSSESPKSSSASRCSSNRKSVSSKLFSWNKEKPRPNSEYVEKKYLKPFNKVAPELRMIGDLGRIKCVGRNERQPLVNRPTQVQKLCHTTTKLLPNFPLTERLRLVACRKKKILSTLEAVQRVKSAKNLPFPSTSLSKQVEKQENTKEIFNHQNPFNLDLNALSDYEKQKYNAEEVERRRNYQIIRRIMETKALKTEELDRIKQEERDEKFKLPMFFNVCDSNENKAEVAAENSTEFFPDGCKHVSTIEKPETFENRSLVSTKLSTKEIPRFDLQLQPFFIPHISQYDLIKDLCKPKDKFHTYRTRSCADIRERNLIESLDFADELIGTEKNRAVSQVATDIDEYYQSEIYHERSRTKFRFQPITEIIKLRETLRNKMDIYWIKEKMILDELDAIKQEALIQRIDNQIQEYEEFLDDFKEKSHRHATKIKKQVPQFYDETDRLRKLHEEIQNNSEPLKMKIFLLGNDFIRLTVFQKLQYLLKPYEWRFENDHIHRTLEGKLESYKDSISNRETVNLWDRNNVTVYTIKDFIMNVYLPNRMEIITIFESGNDVLEAFQNICSKSYLSLLQFHLEANTLTETEKEFILLEEENNAYTQNLYRLVQSLDKKRVFMTARSEEIKQLALKTLDEPLKESVSSEKLRTYRGLCEVTYQDLFFEKSNPSQSKYFSSTEKISQVESKILSLLETLDKIPSSMIRELEKNVRYERKRKLLLAKRAHKIELGVQTRIAQLRRCLTKPPKKEKREGKLPNSVLPKKRSKKKIKLPLLTPVEEEYIRAFTELGDDGEVKFDENAKLMIDRIKNESIPFYVDHLLDTIGIKIPKETIEQSERILQDEAVNFKYKDVLPSVRSQVKLWQTQCETIKKENIRKTPYLYQ